MVLLHILPGSPVCNRICQSDARKRQHLPVKKRNNRSTTRFCEDYRFTLVTYIGIIEVDAVGRSKRKVRLQMANCTDRIKKLKKFIMAGSEMLEFIVAVLTLVGIVLAIIGIVMDVGFFRQILTDSAGFKHYLEQILLLVIGIEFLVMLCRPNSENVIEILIFLVARHMIVGDTTPFEDFVSVVSVVLLCIVRRYLRISEEDREKKKAAES